MERFCPGEDAFQSSLLGQHGLDAVLDNTHFGEV
jgi:hypothetical protein